MGPIMTVAEQVENPYPKCIQTACYTYLTDGAYTYSLPTLKSLHFCEIFSQYYQEGKYWYDAKIVGEGTVTGIPSEAIKFVAGELCNDMHLEAAFRHEIQVPDGLYPNLWLDKQE